VEEHWVQTYPLNIERISKLKNHDFTNPQQPGNGQLTTVNGILVTGLLITAHFPPLGPPSAPDQIKRPLTPRIRKLVLPPGKKSMPIRSSVVENFPGASPMSADHD